MSMGTELFIYVLASLVLTYSLWIVPFRICREIMQLTASIDFTKFNFLKSKA